MTSPTPNSPTPKNGNNDFRAIVIHIAITVAFGLGLLIVAHASSQSLQNALFVVAPVVVLIGAIAMLVRTYRVWKAGGRWQLWQGGSWFLLVFFIVMLFNSAPVLFESNTE
ncbi:MULTISPECIES: hypothetical protein [Gordonia]|jgi:uncharacterized membrane protein YhaH (DUF805 family)|uniref:Uncharacterized protein n=1 Tax=Gordonia amicalis TaxID=89053 RepID=A0AAE4R4N8_9ACTN|nr:MULTISPECIES: hypothetical protein [Gordonia]ATD72935.1 hypothetical protein CNO18_06965 [Gordonia sp. 1D]KAF0969637.1 hypothetical protein BPODLACK_01921 [Gordonia sp. YY1]MBA5849323.1 hypothetical protein [Gordonia amicalis]MCZ4578926.1 hypothetical protein [Gordonia amicalis]MCZ4651749.1 hypothetical protein [Gordonia amicalis]